MNQGTDARYSFKALVKLINARTITVKLLAVDNIGWFYHR